jgi:glycosyltransferase involved in cell wall biosynthesis
MGSPIVLLIAYYFPPDNEIGAARPYRFYKYLKKLGYECHALTAAVQESNATDVESIADPFKVKTHKGIVWQVDRIILKFFWSGGLRIRWSVSAFRAGLLFLKQRKDREVIILSSAPPVSVHLVAMGLAALSRRIWIADFRDPITNASGYSAFFQRILAPGFARLILRRADFSLANTDAMLNAWRDRYPGLEGKTYVLWNGFDPEDEITTYALPERQPKVLSHVGELYGGRDIRPVLHAAARLIESGRVSHKGIIIRQIGPAEQGELPDKEFLLAAQSEGWLEIREPVPAAVARSMALDSDGLLLIQPQSAVQVPGKLFEYLRMGRPILAFVVRDSPAERILQRAGVPFECVYPEHAPEEMEQRLLSFIAMLDCRPVSYSRWFADTFDASRQVGTLDSLIRSLTGR